MPRRAKATKTTSAKKRAPSALQRAPIALKRALQERDEALRFQAAIADILAALSRSRESPQPVFDAIVRNVLRLFDTRYAVVFLIKGEQLELAAVHGDERFGAPGSEAAQRFLASFPQPLDWTSFTGQAMKAGEVRQLVPIIGNPQASPRAVQLARAFGYNSMVTAPLVLDGRVVGTIGTNHAEARRYSERELAALKAFADQAVIALENARLFNETKEALERQIATGEVLSSINSSISDAQPVFDAIVKNVNRLFGCEFTGLELLRDGQIHLVAVASDSERFKGIVHDFPQPLGEDSTTGRAMLQRRVVAVCPIDDPRTPPTTRGQAAKYGGYNSIVGVPMMRGDKVIGAIGAARREAQPFNEGEIALLRSFADQAVIAIENVRLFNETKEALERQTATGEILQTIARSQTDVQPVFDTMVRHAARLCGGLLANVFSYDGEKLHFVASSSESAEYQCLLSESYPMRPDSSQVAGRAVLARGVVRLEDALVDPEYDQRHARVGGWRRIVGVPLLRGDVPVGVIVVTWAEAGLVPKVHEDLLRSFADQAVIAIENVRLFNETTEALERQTATAEVLRVISGSPTDTQPVFDSIAERAARLTGAAFGWVFMYDGEWIRAASWSGLNREAIDRVLKSFPMRPGGGSYTARAIRDRHVVNVADALAENDPDYVTKPVAAAAGYRSVLCVPMCRDEQVVGAITVSRASVGRFSGKEVELLQTFADQAVIAIENVRLFNETREALERQTATGEILSSISSSVADAQPVFDAIVRNLLRLFNTKFVVVQLLRQDGQIDVAAQFGHGDVGRLADGFPRPVDDSTLGGRVILSGRTLEYTPVLDNSEAPPATREWARNFGFNSVIAAPLTRQDKVVGVIVTAHEDATPFDANQVTLIRSFASQAVIAIENARLFNETKEALERQTATAEILTVISSSPTDIRPVLRAVAESAARLCNATDVIIRLVEDDKLHAVEHIGSIPLPSDTIEVPISPKTIAGRAVLEGKTIHVKDLHIPEVRQEYPEAMFLRHSEVVYRTLLDVPMMREGRAIGVIVVRRAERQPFSDQQIELLETFAAQAVIAIENVRLFNETKEALERQTATSEILEIISRSPADVQPVLDAVAERAARLCGAVDALMMRVEGGAMRRVAHFGAIPSASEGRAITRDTPTGRAICDRATVHIADIVDEFARGDFLEAKPLQQATAFRTVLCVPLLRETGVIGALTIRRLEVRPFADNEIALLKTFADQAAIAMENVRLFNETREALDQQKASADVLGAISGSIADTKPVFEMILTSCERLFQGELVGVTLAAGDKVHLAAYHGRESERLKEVYPLPLTRDSGTGWAILNAAMAHFPDTEAPGVPPGVVAGCRALKVRAIIFAPMLIEGKGIGAIWVARSHPGAFGEKQIDQLRTFADQAVIAIENARLFNETKEALERQTATAEVLRVIARSPTDTQPVFDALLEKAVRLCGAQTGMVFRREGDLMRMVAAHGASPAYVDYVREHGATLDRSTVTGRTAVEGRTVHILDVTQDFEYSYGGQSIERYRSTLGVPLLREGMVIGVFTLWRHRVEAFTPREVSLVETFADQAVIAIENVRLFNETREALDRQTTTSEILRVISGTPTETQPVFDAIVESGLRVFSGAGVAIVLVAGDGIRVVAAGGILDRSATTQVVMPRTRESATGTAIVERRTVNIADTEASDAPRYVRENGRQLGFRAMAAAPMLREGQAIGAIGVMLGQPGGLTDKQLELLQTFADQAVIAIENARLFNETKEALEQQTATAEVLRVISSSPGDVQPVFDAITERAMALCGATMGATTRVEAGMLQLASYRGSSREGEEAMRASFPMPVSRAAVTGRAVLERAPVHIEDVFADPDYQLKPGAERSGWRATMAVPLLHDGEAVGAIAVTRAAPGRFPAKSVALLETFARQAVLAIENVRLFNETKEALERQSATADILASISSAIADTQPVFDAIVQSVRRLFDTPYAVVALLEQDMLVLKALAGDGRFMDRLKASYPWPVNDDGMMTIRAMHTGQVAQLAPIAGNPLAPPKTVELAKAIGYDSLLVAPLTREGKAIGYIAAPRVESTGFDDKQVALIKSFADQAVIAIENARLFNETKEALEQQTATAEVLKLISRTTFDLDKVLQALLDNATRLSGATRAAMLRPDGEGNYLPVVTYRYELPMLNRMHERPIRAGRDSINGRALLEKRAIHVPDVLADPEYGRQDLVKLDPYRTVLAVPMLRDGEAVGLITLTRAQPAPFTDKQIELVTTLADQAVIAIENVRLFDEIQEKSRQLEIANKHKSEFLANMSHELRTPLNAIIGFSEVLIEKMFGEVNERQLDYLKDIHESGKHLLSLINDILDLSKIEAGRMELELARFDLPSAIGNATTLVRERAQRHRIELAQDIDPRLGEVQADERKVKQILLNLLSNAVKFTPDGGRVEVTARLDTDKVEIAVRDTGIGIAPEDQAQLFEEFKQVGRDGARKAEGTGLGLALTKKFVELHGGEIRVQSAPGAGATFTVSLPLRAS